MRGGQHAARRPASLNGLASTDKSRSDSPDQVAGRRFFNVSSTPAALARRCLSRWPSDCREARDRLKHSQAGKGRPLVSGATNGVTIMPTT